MTTLMDQLYVLLDAFLDQPAASLVIVSALGVVIAAVFMAA